MLVPFDRRTFPMASAQTAKATTWRRGLPTLHGEKLRLLVPGAPQDENVLAGSFGARFRGFINILPEWVNQTLHFGFLTDEAVAMSCIPRQNRHRARDQTL